MATRLAGQTPTHSAGSICDAVERLLTGDDPDGQARALLQRASLSDLLAARDQQQRGRRMLGLTQPPRLDDLALAMAFVLAWQE